MARTAKVSPVTQEDVELNGQLSLFSASAKKFDEESTVKKEAAPVSNGNAKPVGKTKKPSSINYSAADIQVLILL